MQLFIGFVVTFFFTAITWELIKLVLEAMGNFGKNEWIRRVIIFLMGFFFAIGYTGFVYYMSNDMLKTRMRKNVVFVSLIVYVMLLLARAIFFWNGGFDSVMLICFTTGVLIYSLVWVLAKPEQKHNNLSNNQLRKYNRLGNW